MQPFGANLWYFKHRLFDLTEFINSCDFLTFFNIDFDGYYIVRTERVNRDRNIFSKNVELTPTFLCEVWSIINTEFYINFYQYGNARFIKVPLIWSKNMEDTVVFLTWKVNSVNFSVICYQLGNAQVTPEEKPQIKLNF